MQTYRTDEFGVLTDIQGALDQPFGYTGEQRDAEAGLVFLRARYYDPASGRFVSRDPFKGVPASPSSLHRYVYVTNNPISAVDPSGMCGSQNSWVDQLQFALDLGGLVPFLGEPADLVNAGIYGIRGDYLNAGLSVAAAVPVVGDAATAGKLLNKAGGVYRLVDGAGNTRYVGRTMDLARRKAEHGADEVKGSLEFRILEETTDYATQRGLEQMHYAEFGPDLNRIRPVSPGNPNLSAYLSAAQELLSVLGGR